DFRPGNDNTQQNPPLGGNYAGTLFLNAGGTPAPDNGPSWPIYIDPVGAASSQSQWVAGQSGGVRRIDSPWMSPQSLYPLYPNALANWKLYSFQLMDDMVFDTNGIPLGNPTRGLQRGTQYSWAYLVRRPRTACASVVDVTIVVYAGRPVYLSGISAGET